MALLLGMLRAAVHLAAPLLLVSLAAGLLLGVLQTATQLNEASVAFVAKVAAVLAVLVLAGPALAGYAVQYTRANLLAVESVVR
ncbi:MAG: flagellar biosynthetic protein FliQ [Deltaproteobacteria bacterium]|nr:flagellar biosynthetic protein FliQ [Deltaproteobacteria bacterium]